MIYYTILYYTIYYTILYYTILYYTIYTILCMYVYMHIYIYIYICKEGRPEEDGRERRQGPGCGREVVPEGAPRSLSLSLSLSL